LTRSYLPFSPTAVHMYGGRIILSNGLVDDDTVPYNLLLTSGVYARFSYYHDRYSEPDTSCFPAHTACLNLLREIDEHCQLDDRNTRALYDIFQSAYYERKSGKLR
jgi:hypothetical protein